MFLATIIIPFYVLAIIAIFFINSFQKGMLFMVMMLIATFILFLFITNPLPSAMGVICFMALFAFKLKD
ncbi:hypothetical protein [Pedobacter frigidisoli]|uniref:hypothetical protein n=1 Tax=Pedobacter frigidisoli TaxID=2530455 RepID=UPI0029307F2A|nr:hypothetical protein [Pedobacter frigidisoli]